MSQRRRSGGRNPSGEAIVAGAAHHLRTKGQPFAASPWGMLSRKRLSARSPVMRVWSGHPYPLGATWDGAGVNFALFSEHATKVELCLFDSREAKKESQRIVLREQDEF